MDVWSQVKQMIDVCPISLHDVFANPGSSFPSLPSTRIDEGKGAFDRSNTLPVLCLNGSHREIGQQEGSVLRKQIQAFIQHYLSSSIGRNRTKFRKLRKRANTCKEFIPDRYLEEMDGLSDGTGLSSELLLSGSVFLDFYSTVLCSNIAISPGGTEEQRLTVGRNLDFPSMGAAHRLTLFKAINPDGYYRHVHLIWPGLTGVLTGMNEHGLTLALSEVDGAEPFGSGLPYTLMQRRILEECKTTDEAEEMVRSLPRTRSNNLLVADATGDLAVLEYDRTGVARRNPERNWVYATNHFVSGVLSNHYLSFKYLSAAHRYRKISEVHAAGEKISAGHLFEMLKQLALGRLNLASMLMYPVERTMMVRIGAPPAANRTSHKLDLNPYFESDLDVVGRGAKPGRERQ